MASFCDLRALNTSFNGSAAMETVGLVMLLLIIGWQIVALRRQIATHAYSTTVFYAVESEEAVGPGIAEQSVQLRKKFWLPTAICPGMEFAGIANNAPTPVVRVVFDSEGRGVHLKPGRASIGELEATAKWYVSRGWVRDV